MHPNQRIKEHVNDKPPRKLSGTSGIYSNPINSVSDKPVLDLNPCNNKSRGWLVQQQNGVHLRSKSPAEYSILAIPPKIPILIFKKKIWWKWTMCIATMVLLKPNWGDQV